MWLAALSVQFRHFDVAA